MTQLIDEWYRRPLDTSNRWSQDNARFGKRSERVRVPPKCVSCDNTAVACISHCAECHAKYPHVQYGAV